MPLLASLGLETASILQPYLFPKTLALGIIHKNELNVIHNYVNIIWVQDQTFTSWNSTWEWI